MRLRASPVVRSILWRLGRKLYTYARGEGPNDPQSNGEYWLLERVLRESTGSQVLLDIGANTGNWTAEALHLARPTEKIHVHAFEPSPGTRSSLAARFFGNGAVTVEAFALADAPGEAAFYTSEDGAGTNSLSPSPGARADLTSVTTIDEFIRDRQIGTVRMMKIDTEGFDLLVLRGAQRSLQDAHIEIVQFEYNWRWLVNHACLRDVFDFISDKPYVLGKLVGKDLEFYDRWHVELDRFFETNYVLLRKDSPLCSLGSAVHFDQSSVGVRL